MSESEPKLDKPGAGIPFLEKWIVRFWILPRYSKRISWSKSLETFEKEGRRILQACQPLSAAQLHQKVLIDRIQGIEDSSRYWSAAMTIEHLMIVGKGIAEIIQNLTQDKAPSIRVDIAQVKPSRTNASTDILPEFEAFLDSTKTALINGRLNHESKLKLKHPWFGKLSAKKWNFLLASHQSVHRKQVMKILEKISV